MDYIELQNKVRGMIKPSRFVHSLGVAETAFFLAKRFDLDEGKALCAGIYHDAYRYSADGKCIELLRKNGFVIEKEEEEEPMLLHGALAALHFDEDAGEPVGDDMKKAVRYHTLGSKDMGPLGAAIYIADYIEPGRKHLSDEVRTEILNLGTMEEMITKIITLQRPYLESTGTKLAGISEELYEYIEKGGKL